MCGGITGVGATIGITGVGATTGVGITTGTIGNTASSFDWIDESSSIQSLALEFAARSRRQNGLIGK
jgi:hypothetical protein